MANNWRLLREQTDQPVVTKSKAQPIYSKDKRSNYVDLLVVRDKSVANKWKNIQGINSTLRDLLKIGRFL